MNQKILESLHPLERKVLPHITKKISLDKLIELSGLMEVEVLRAIQWLSTKNIVTIDEEELEIIVLGENGKIYQKQGLPEIRFLQNIGVDTSKQKLKDYLSEQEISVCIGLLKQNSAIEVKKEKDLLFSITNQGRLLLSRPSLEQEFLKLQFPIKKSDLMTDQLITLNSLRKRKDIVAVETQKRYQVQLTDLGKSLDLKKIDSSMVDKLTPEILQNWKNQTFRRFDIQSKVPRIYQGRRHFVYEAREYIKQIWLDLGFKEMVGPKLQTSFWNFDALFTSQEHSARDMHDTFFIKEPKYGTLPKLKNKVKDVHETGGDTNSSGWKYQWQEDLAKLNVLRTHTTCLSAKTLSELKEKQGKFFSIGRVFRNETLDHSHLFEFTQIEGIVVDKNVNFKHLIAYLRIFFNKMGYPKVRIRPAYFPYTEPSAEVDVYDPKRDEWLEIAGAGILRPEVVVPLLGEDVPVLAWGMGLERIVSEYYHITDIRDLYKNDLAQLRTIKTWIR